MGRKIAYNNSNWSAVYLNLRKALRWWDIILGVLESTGANMWAWGAMYKAVAQSIILYGSKIWVVTGEMLKVLEGFHHRAARQITGLTEKCRAGREWEYPSVEEAMETAGIHPIVVYIKRQQTTI